MVHRADRFREFLSGTICGCLSSIPSFALIIIAMVLILMLIASIPLAFILTYHPSALSTDKANREKVPELVHRYHSAWPNATVNMTDPSSIKMSALIPPNVTTCHGYGFSCTSTPV
jgi:ABC-type bacteriocin/lantibiotic exporter with double-glycine peptidase domain